MASIHENLSKIINAVFGRDIRQALHDGLDAINKETESTTSRQDYLDRKYDEQIKNMTVQDPSSAEIVDMRVAANGKTFEKAGDRLNYFDEQLDKKTKLTNKRIAVINESGDVEGVIDLANFAGQGTDIRDIMAKLHNYTDSDVMWLDNVGEGNCILRLNNSRNPLRRADKPSDYVGSGDYIVLGRHKDDGSIYYQVLKIDKNGNFIFNNSTELTGAIKFDNNKLPSDGEAGFIFRTPSGTHTEVIKLITGVTDRELLSFGGHGSGTLALMNVGSLMTQGLAIVFNEVNETQHLKFGTANNPYTVPNVMIKSFAPTSIKPNFIGQMFINTIDKSVYMATEVVAGGWTKLSN